MKRLLTQLGLLLSMCVLAVAAIAKPVNINTANATEIAAALKDVGPAKADAIVAYRKAHGPFHNADDLTKVKGIGNATVERNRKNIMVKVKPAHKKQH